MLPQGLHNSTKVRSSHVDFQVGPTQKVWFWYWHVVLFGISQKEKLENHGSRDVIWISRKFEIQAMLHGEQFVADSCSNVDSGYEGVRVPSSTFLPPEVDSKMSWQACGLDMRWPYSIHMSCLCMWYLICFMTDFRRSAVEGSHGDIFNRGTSLTPAVGCCFLWWLPCFDGFILAF